METELTKLELEEEEGEEETEEAEEVCGEALNCVRLNAKHAFVCLALVKCFAFRRMSHCLDKLTDVLIISP